MRISGDTRSGRLPLAVARTCQSAARRPASSRRRRYSKSPHRDASTQSSHRTPRPRRVILRSSRAEWSMQSSSSPVARMLLHFRQRETQARAERDSSAGEAGADVPASGNRSVVLEYKVIGTAPHSANWSEEDRKRRAASMDCRRKIRRNFTDEACAHEANSIRSGRRAEGSKIVWIKQGAGASGRRLS